MFLDFGDPSVRHHVRGCGLELLRYAVGNKIRRIQRPGIRGVAVGHSVPVRHHDLRCFGGFLQKEINLETYENKMITENKVCMTWRYRKHTKGMLADPDGSAILLLTKLMNVSIIANVIARPIES